MAILNIIGMAQHVLINHIMIPLAHQGRSFQAGGHIIFRKGDWQKENYEI